jgi:hypothetical protein
MTFQAKDDTFGHWLTPAPEKQLPHYIKVGQSKRTWGIRRFGVLEDWYKTA